MTELENALQSIVMKMGNSSPSDKNPYENEAAKVVTQLQSDILPPTPSASSVTSPEASLENAPVFSLFDNSILSRVEENADSAVAAVSSPIAEKTNHPNPKHDHICKTLLSFFPPPKLQDAFLDGPNLWWQASQAMFPQMLGIDPGLSSIKDFIAELKASNDVQKIAKALLCITLTLQETPPPNANLGLGPSDTIASLRAKCINVIDELIIPDDEIVGTFEGVECLFLRAWYEMNNGRIGKSWILDRRALSFAQLLGLQLRKGFSPTSETANQRRRSVWKALYQSDRYLSLLLGLPYAVSDVNYSAAHDSHPNEQYLLRLANIIGHVIDRNQEPPSSNTLPATVKIEGELSDLSASMPSQWWDIDPEENVGPGQMHSRIVPQLWHHQVRILLHLPFMLKASTDRRYEYNRLAALESSRAMINRYCVFRPARGFGSEVCKVVDFQIFTAAMVLVLNLLTISPSSSARDQQEAKEDEELITTTTEILNRAAQVTDDGVTTQAARALKMFCKTHYEPCPSGQTTAKVVIPYFGTVVFGRGKSFANESYLNSSKIARQQQQQQPSIQLPTPETTTPNSLTQDPAEFNNYLATLPDDFNFGGFPLQQEQGLGMDNGVFANANLDLDQDWSWFWNNTNVP